METNVSKHTQGEWIVDRYKQMEDGELCNKIAITNKDETQAICFLPELHKEAEANAVFIVTACNNHLALVEALERCLDVLKQLADAGNYPFPLLAENGGEGYMFITKLLKQINESK